MLNESVLADYCEGFFGFGCWTAPIWLIGIEEAGGRDETEIARRLSAWDARGRLELEDAPTFYPATEHNSWHGLKAELQPTWAQLIRMLFRARSKNDTEESLLDYQQRLGAVTGETCLLELLPLPSPQTGIWKYGGWSKLPWMQSREAYFHAVSTKRARKLKESIRAHAPRLVVFYGTTLTETISLLPTWSRIADGKFDQAVGDRKILLERQSGHTAYFVTKHPAAKELRRNPDAYFQEVGDLLREKCSLFA